MKTRKLSYIKLLSLIMSAFIAFGCISFTSFAEDSGQVGKTYAIKAPTGVKIKVIDFQKGSMTADGMKFKGNIMTLKVQFNRQSDANQYWLAMLKRDTDGSDFQYIKKGTGNIPDILAAPGEKAKFADQNPGPNGEKVTESGNVIIVDKKICQLEKPTGNTLEEMETYQPGDTITVWLIAAHMKNNDPGTYKDSEMVTIDIPFNKSSVGKTFTFGENNGEEKKTAIAIPKGKKLVYNGKKQEGVSTGEGYTLKGNKAKKVGKYKATVTLKDGFCWKDGSTGPKTITYSIERRNNKVEIEKTKIKKTYATKSLKKISKYVKLPKITARYGQKTAKWIVTQKDAKKFISLQNGKIKVKKNTPAGTYTMKLAAKVPQGDTYKSGKSKTLTVTIKVK